jgi:hypothetical protein
MKVMKDYSSDEIEMFVLRLTCAICNFASRIAVEA